MACLGHGSDLGIGESVEDILMGLRTQFCGCTHVYGNIRISMTGLNGNLTENDFNFFYHLEQISGALVLNGIPETTLIILPNLRIIRGQELFGDFDSSVILRNINSGAIIFPKLTEISRGGIFVDQPVDYPLCSLALINWRDILDDGEISAPRLELCQSGCECRCRDQ